MKTCIVSRKIKDYAHIRQLFQSSFPNNEQIPLWLLKMLSYRKNVKFIALYDKEDFCGIIYTIENEQYLFILYLVVDPRLRSRGYGSKIINFIKQHTTKIIVLNVESVKIVADNHHERLKRMNFYERNGIYDTGYIFEEGGETYSILASDIENFDIKKYKQMIVQFSFGLYRIKTISSK